MKSIRLTMAFILILVIALAVLKPPPANLALETTQVQDPLKKQGPPKYIRLEVDGQAVFSGALARIIDDHSLVPLRPVAEACGASVKWDPQQRSIEVEWKDGKIAAVVDQNQVEVNGKMITADIAPQFNDGEVLMPLKLLRETFNLNVVWDGSLRTLHIYTAAYKAPPPVSQAGKPQTVPILMYHELGENASSLYVRDSEFKEQMAYLKENNYRVVTLSQAYRMLKNSEPMDKTVVITFDDGYKTFYEKAWPVLSEYKFPATVFVIANFSTYPNYLSWERMSKLYAGWMEIGSHSQTHPSLPKTSRAHGEIFESKSMIQNHLQVPCEVFCYPGGFFNAKVTGLVKEAGYTLAVTTQPGKASLSNDPVKLPRVRIPRGMSLQNFAKSL